MPSLARIFASRDSGFYDMFEKLAATGVSAAEHLVELLEIYPDRRDEIIEALARLEHEGDGEIHRIRDRLTTSSVTPVDREDVFKLSSALDDVIDLTEEVANYLVLYGIEAPMEQAQELAAILLAATRQVALAVPGVREFSDVSEPMREIHRLENEGDRLSRDAIASLFSTGIDPMVVIRWKDIFERLEQAIDATERVADVIDEIIIKNP